MSWLSDKWQDFKAWRRGEKRIAKGRGRVYERKEGGRIEPMPAGVAVSAKITAKVIRADGSIEEYEATNVRIGDGGRSNDSGP